MLDGLTGDLNEKQNRYLVRIKSNADRLARLINDLLDLSRIEAGIKLKRTNLYLPTVAREVVESLGSVAAEKLSVSKSNVRRIISQRGRIQTGSWRF